MRMTAPLFVAGCIAVMATGSAEAFTLRLPQPAPAAALCAVDEAPRPDTPKADAAALLCKRFVPGR